MDGNQYKTGILIKFRILKKSLILQFMLFFSLVWRTQQIVQNSDHTSFFTLIMLQKTVVKVLCVGIIITFLACTCLRTINTSVKDHIHRKNIVCYK